MVWDAGNEREIVLLTNLLEFGATTIAAIYKERWQIALSFKRIKSILGLGHLPKKDPASARAWLHGKLLTDLLVERFIQAANAFPPLAAAKGKRLRQQYSLS